MSRETSLHMLQRDFERFLEFVGSQIVTARPTQARRLGGDGLVVFREFGDQFLRFNADPFDDGLRIGARRGELAVTVAIDADWVRRAEGAWLPDSRTRLIGFRNGPIRSGDRR